MKKNVEEYIKTHPVFCKLYYEKQSQDKAEKEKMKQTTREIMGHKVNLIKHLQQVIIEISFPGLLIEFTQEEYDVLMRGHFSETMEDKWNIIPGDNCLHFCRSWTGDEIYRVEILHEKCQHGDYKIRTFYVDRDKVDEHFFEYLDHSICSILLLLFWVMLKRDIRPVIFEKYVKQRDGILRLWSDFGNILFTEDDE